MRSRLPLRSLGAAALLLLGAEVAVAQPVPVIEAGREAEVQALFAPLELGDPLPEGWRFETIAIGATAIRAGAIRGEGESVEEAALVLRHPDDPEAGSHRTASFAIAFEGPRAPLAPLARAVGEHDEGGFWRVEARPRGEDGSPFGAGRPTRDLGALTLLGLFFLGVLALAFRAAARQDDPDPMPAGRVRLLLLGIALAGAAVRLTMAPRMLLGAWVRSRWTRLHIDLWESPELPALAGRLGARWSEIDVLTASGLAFALLTPFAVFAHGRHLLGGRRRALYAALIVAALPMHVRFSFSEVAFIPSIVFSSTLFALGHTALKDPARPARVSAWLLLGPVTAGVMVARPLNALFLLLFAGLLLGLVPSASRRRRLLVAAPVLLVGGVLSITHLWAHYARNVREGASIEVVWKALRLLFDVEANALWNPAITPTLLLFVAVGGAIVLRRPGGQERRRGAFLLVWLAVFFATHAYVVPRAPAMQARYHLHLVVPFAFLVAVGLEALGRARPRLLWPLVAYVALAPLIHAGFIRDVGFNDHREVTLVHRAAARLPDGCVVIEREGPEGAIGARFRRVGSVVEEGERGQRFEVHTVSDGGPLPEGVRRALEAPPACLAYYEGLACFSEKRPGEPISPVCARIRRAARWRRVVDDHFESRPYDSNLARGFGPTEAHLRLTVYRAEAR